MFQEIGNICVIGLEQRKDRWDRCKEIFSKYGITPVTHYCTVQDYNDPHRHYMKDFLQMLRVRATGEYFVFFEDDFELTEGWEDVFKKAWEELPPDFDMLYLGANLTDPVKKHSDHLVRVMGAWLMHSVIMSRKWVNYILKYYDFNRIWIIDDWFERMAPDRKFYMTIPMICYQRPDFSDFLGQYVYYDIFKNKIYEDYCTSTQLSPDSELRSGVDASRDAEVSKELRA